jgi:hypothetical protein
MQARKDLAISRLGHESLLPAYLAIVQKMQSAYEWMVVPEKIKYSSGVISHE